MSICAALGARARNARDRTPNVEGEEVNEDESLSAGRIRGKGRVANKAQGNVDEKENAKLREVVDVQVECYCETEYKPRHVYVHQLEAETSRDGTTYHRGHESSPGEAEIVYSHLANQTRARNCAKAIPPRPRVPPL